MNKEYKFNFKLDADDRERLLWLSRRLERTQSDTLRWLVRQAAGGRHAPREEAPGPLSPDPLTTSAEARHDPF